MPGTFFDEGMQFMNAVFFQAANRGELRASVYANEIELVNTLILADFLIPDLSPAAGITLSDEDWVLETDDGTTTGQYPVFTLEFNEYEGDIITLFGLLIYAPDAERALWAQALPTPFNVPLTGGSITMQITYLDGACPS